MKISDDFLVLHVIVETDSNTIVAFSFDKERTANSTIKLIKSSLNKYPNMQNRIFHTDRRAEYANYTVKKFLEENGIVKSMTPKGDSLANRPCEYLFGNIKRECLYRNDLNEPGYPVVLKSLNNYIYFYQNDLVQSNLRFFTPSEFNQLNV